jgi:hypothetical protein
LHFIIFSSSIAKIDNHQNWPLVFVNDNLNTIDELIPEIKLKIISRNNEITDFLILQNAGKLIISKSIYSCWAAYINEHSTAHAYSPKYFLGFKKKKRFL